MLGFDNLSLSMYTNLQNSIISFGHVDMAMCLRQERQGLSKWFWDYVSLKWIIPNYRYLFTIYY